MLSFTYWVYIDSKNFHNHFPPMRSLTYWIYIDSLKRYTETKRQNFPLQKRTNIEMLSKRFANVYSLFKKFKIAI